MGIRITEDGVVNYENQPDINRELFPNLNGCCAELRTEIDELKENFRTNKTAYLNSNCAEMMSLLYLPTKTSGGVTFTPSNNNKTITTTGTPSGTYQYALVNGNISEYPFEAGNTYRLKYNAPANAYFQVISNGSNVVLNTMSFDGIKEFTIPSDTTTLKINLYCAPSVQTGTHTISIINKREYDYLEYESFTVRPTTEELKNIVGYTAKNLFDGIGTTSGKYVNANNGKIQDLASYSVTDFFKVVAGATYKLPYHASGSQIAFYDINEAYVPSSGFVTTSDTLTVPNNNNIVFARWCADTANLASWALYIVPITDRRIKYIDQTEGILAGVIDAYSNGVTDIIVKSGNYDIITEYKQKFGNNYFADYTSNYNGKINGNFDRGIWLDNVNIKFESGATVAANYDADADDPNYPNANVKQYFSAFAVGQNVVIDGLVLDASELRYGIHADFHANQNENLTIKNSDLHHYKSSSSVVNNNQAIGAGLGVYSVWNIENCIFRSDTSNPVVRIHNNVSSNAKSKIYIRNCYVIGNGYILLNSYSTSTKQTNALVTGCSWLNPVVVGKETNDSENNITLYAWNNEVRT